MFVKNNYRFTTPLAMCYFAFYFVAASLTHKFIYIGGHTVSAGSFVMPFWFMVCDIITEVYGYRQTRFMLWCFLPIQFVFYGILQLFSTIQPHDTVNGIAYSMVFGSMLRMAFAIWPALFIAHFLNTYVMSKSKIIFTSRYFWLRSVAASTAGEILYTAVGFYGILSGTVSTSTLEWMILWGCILKITTTAIIALPVTILIGALKRAENVDTYDMNIDFNPFKISMSS